MDQENKIRHSVDGRYFVYLDRTDVELAEVMLQSGMTRLEVIWQYIDSDYSIPDASSIVTCAQYRLMDARVVK